jgi:hypothetical protein
MAELYESAVTLTPKMERIAGIVLLAAAFLTIVAMAHHPTAIESADQGMRMSLGGLVHATMIVLLGANLWALTVFSLRLEQPGWALAGILAYGISFVGNGMAALINGFIVPAVAGRVDRAVSGDLFVMLWQSNQAAAHLGVYAASGAIFLWSIGLLRRGQAINLIIGIVGVLAALIPSLALYTGAITLNVSGAFIAYGVQAAWTGLLGLKMILRSE